MLLLAVSVALMGFAPAPLPRQQRQRADPTDLSGTWEFVLWEDSGRRSRRNEEQIQARMTRDSFTLVLKRRGEGETYTMRLEPSASPPAFTWEMNGETVFVGSYRFERGQMTMILNEGDRLADRPIDFAGKARHRFVLRRISR
jgi:uncharacterized protein (TIGR03067 family)